MDNRISKLEIKLTEAIALVEQLKNEIKQESIDAKEIMPWRAYFSGLYYHMNGVMEIDGIRENKDNYDDTAYENGNYYKSRGQAERDKKDIIERNKIRQLRDILCEDYQFIYDKTNYSIYYNEDKKHYCVGQSCVDRGIGEIYFDTLPHAQAAADWMNKNFNGEEHL